MVKKGLILRYNTSEADICYRLRKRLDNLGYTINQEVRIMTEEKFIQNKKAIDKLLGKKAKGITLTYNENKKLEVGYKGARKQVARFDLFINKELVIEVKNKDSAKGLLKQVKRYENLGFKVITCIGDKGISNTIKQVKYHFNQTHLCHLNMKQ